MAGRKGVILCQLLKKQVKGGAAGWFCGSAEAEAGAMGIFVREGNLMSPRAGAWPRPTHRASHVGLA